MKNIRKIICFTIIFILSLTICFASITSIKAIGELTLGKWTFIQGGVYALDERESEWGNVAYIDSVTMNGTGENINGWLEDDGTHNTNQACCNQSQSASQTSDGFVLKIKNNGWDRDWGADPWRINPWSIRSLIKTDMMPFHKMRVSFKAKADKKKYGYILFSTSVGSVEETPYYDIPFEDGSSTQVFALNNNNQEFTYTFSNYVGGKDLKICLFWGAFGPANDNKAYDFEGNDISNIVTEEESRWKGTVTVSDFKVEDLGYDPNVPTPVPSVTQRPTMQPVTTQKPTAQPRTTKKPSVSKQYITVNATKNVYYKTRFSLNAKTSGNGKLTYKSSDTNIASVSASGVVTTHGCGMVKITIIASKTSGYYASQKEVIFNIKPKNGSGLRLKSTKRNVLRITWKRSRDADGYLVQLCKTKKFNKSVLQKTFSKNKKKTTVRFANQSHKKFFVRMKLFKKTNGIIYYGKWSKVKKKRIK